MYDKGIFVFGSKIFPKEQDAICLLPLELSWKIFSYLDDISLRNASRTYKTWHRIILAKKQLRDRLNHFELVIKMGSESLVQFYRRNKKNLRKSRRRFKPSGQCVLKTTKITTSFKRGGDDLVITTKRYKLF